MITRLSLAAAAVLLLAGCASTQPDDDVMTPVDAPEVALTGAELADELQPQLDKQMRQLGESLPAEVHSCEDVPVLKAGVIADCRVRDSGGPDFRIRVTIEDEAGHYVWEAFQ